MGQPTLCILTSDPALQRAVAAHFVTRGGFRVTGELPPANEPGDPVLALLPVSECSLDRCRQLAAEGLSVLVLAAIPRRDEKAAYLAAGAVAYLPMTVSPAGLVDDVREAIQVGPTSGG
jgi:DNA-binding NarL/FixJ family response regulator